MKELGAVVYNCSCLAADLGKIFEAYWFLGESQSIPSPWPTSFSTLYNKDTPLQLPLNNTPSNVYLSVRYILGGFIFIISLYYLDELCLLKVCFLMLVPKTEPQFLVPHYKENHFYISSLVDLFI